MAGAPTRPGVYLFRDRHEQVLYVGRARDLRARLRSYFRGERQRPAVEAALGALARVEWRVLGSELEAALEELRLLRELRPPANARSTRPDRHVYLRRRGDGWVVSEQPTELGPLKSRRLAQAAARVLAGFDDPTSAPAAIRARLRRLRFEHQPNGNATAGGGDRVAHLARHDPDPDRRIGLRRGLLDERVELVQRHEPRQLDPAPALGDRDG